MATSKLTAAAAKARIAKYPKTAGQVRSGDGNADLSAWGIGGGPKATAEPDFSGVQAEANTDALGMLPTMVERLRELQRLEAEAATAAALAAQNLADFQMKTLPEAMELAGVASFKLADGSELVVKDDVKASIKKDNADDAYAWLQQQGHGGVIKTAFDIDVRALDDKERERLLKAIEKAAPDTFVEVNQSVHHSTLKSLVKELLEDGITLPPSFSVFEFKKAALKEPKGK